MKYDNQKTLYYCNPKKHKDCKKTYCKHNGMGKCDATAHPEYAKRNWRGKPKKKPGLGKPKKKKEPFFTDYQLGFLHGFLTVMAAAITAIVLNTIWR